MQGINLNELVQKFGKIQQNNCLQQSQKHLNNNLLEIKDDYLRLTRSGIFVSDGIMCDLMI
ncbi:hypothetical protein FACS189413_16430 [Bacteroidia bacterium]|nr:hypothetical protein FACS189413_16430 [Bacteroidia bacterium]